MSLVKKNQMVLLHFLLIKKTQRNISKLFEHNNEFLKLFFSENIKTFIYNYSQNLKSLYKIFENYLKTLYKINKILNLHIYIYITILKI